MRDSNIKVLLFLSILVMSALPMVASFYFLDRALQTSLDLGFNRQMILVLEDESRNLKILKNVDPTNQEHYREQFNEVEELRHIYAKPELVKGSIRNSLIIYFGLGLIAAVLSSILLAALLSRSIARAYKVTYEELSRNRERVRYLEQISSWQELAKMLAHEIKNPLTPIEVLITSLSRAYLAKPESEFRAQLSQTQTMINEELSHLKNTVNRFSEFAKLPAVRLTEENLSELVPQYAKVISAMFDSASIQLEGFGPEAVRAKIDGTLLRQVLTNIVKNGVEANPGRNVEFKVRMASEEASITVSISNNGEPVPTTLAGRMFDPYVSSKNGKDNMGLGLAIVRKIMIEHGGDVTYAELQSHPTFTIAVPKIG
jgi:signal transduction histidine kinase